MQWDITINLYKNRQSVDLKIKTHLFVKQIAFSIGAFVNMKFLAICMFALVVTSLAGESKIEKRGIMASHAYNGNWPIAPALEITQPIQTVHTKSVERVLKPYVVPQDHVVIKHIDQPRLVPQPFEVINHVAQPVAVPVERTILKHVSVPQPVLVHKETVQHYPVDVLVPQPYDVIKHVPIVTQPEPVWVQPEPIVPLVHGAPIQATSLW